MRRLNFWHTLAVVLLAIYFASIFFFALRPLLGWRGDAEHLQQIDILLHPARAEPYGMVITEAMAAQARVVVSDVCGAMMQVTADAGAVVPLGALLEQWMDTVRKQLRCDVAPPIYTHGWHEVAQEYEALYRLIASE